MKTLAEFDLEYGNKSYSAIRYIPHVPSDNTYAVHIMHLPSKLVLSFLDLEFDI